MSHKGRVCEHKLDRRRRAHSDPHCLRRIVHPKTLVRWHREGFRVYWRWKSRRRGGRPKAPNEVRALIRQMGAQNPLWGAPRIHGELLKLGFDVSQVKQPFPGTCLDDLRIPITDG